MRASATDFLCKLNNRTGVHYNQVIVGYKPSHVNTFKCHSKNWQSMNCTFMKPDNPMDAKYKLKFSVDREQNRRDQYECMLTSGFDKTYTCLITENSPGGIYRQTYPTYYFTLTSENPLGKHSDEFIINHYASVVPKLPQNLTSSNITTSSTWLSWLAPVELFSFPKRKCCVKNTRKSAFG